LESVVIQVTAIGVAAAAVVVAVQVVSFELLLVFLVSSALLPSVLIEFEEIVEPPNWKMVLRTLNCLGR
jgi:hypothetical protein